MLLLLLFIFACVSAQDVLIYPSSVYYNGTHYAIETHAFCSSPAIQFNGSSSLFPSNSIVWVYQKNYFEVEGTFQRVRPDYGSYLVNPTVTPIDTIAWRVYPCAIGDVSGVVSSFGYIPENSTFTLTAACSLSLPYVYACYGNVPATFSPTENPTESPSAPTFNPTDNPSGNPTRQPTRLQTSSGHKLADTVGYWVFMCVMVYMCLKK